MEYYYKEYDENDMLILVEMRFAFYKIRYSSDYEYANYALDRYTFDNTIFRLYTIKIRDVDNVFEYKSEWLYGSHRIPNNIIWRNDMEYNYSEYDVVNIKRNCEAKDYFDEYKYSKDYTIIFVKHFMKYEITYAVLKWNARLNRYYFDRKISKQYFDSM